jgi:hypothetical protein
MFIFTFARLDRRSTPVDAEAERNNVWRENIGKKAGLQYPSSVFSTRTYAGIFLATRRHCIRSPLPTAPACVCDRIAAAGVE